MRVLKAPLLVLGFLSSTPAWAAPIEQISYRLPQRQEVLAPTKRDITDVPEITVVPEVERLRVEARHESNWIAVGLSTHPDSPYRHRSWHIDKMLRHDVWGEPDPLQGCMCFVIGHVIE
jgi:hypothetical protein